ncbi:MAG: alpha/beta hydrolase [Chloroflexota bacterium]
MIKNHPQTPATIPYQEEQLIEVNGLKIAYDVFGHPHDPPLLLIGGLGMTLIGWEEAFCQQLARSGFRVIRYDNRDAGHSSKFDQHGTPSVVSLLRMAFNHKPPAAYTLADMADDAAGLMDALNIPAAHVVGTSMGGMIAQTLAINHPQRLLSLTSIMSSTNHPSLPLPQWRAMLLLVAPTPADKEAHIVQSRKTWQLLNGPAYPLDVGRHRLRMEAVLAHGLYPEGTARQLAAIGVSGSRREALRQVEIPALVIHGDADPLVPVEGGLDTAASLPNATLLIIPGLGHAMPPEVWPLIVEAIVDHARENG